MSAKHCRASPEKTGRVSGRTSSKLLTLVTSRA